MTDREKAIKWWRNLPLDIREEIVNIEVSIRGTLVYLEELNLTRSKTIRLST